MHKHSTVKKMIRTIVSKPSKPNKPVRGSRAATNKKRMGYGKKN